MQQDIEQLNQNKTKDDKQRNQDIINLQKEIQKYILDIENLNQDIKRINIDHDIQINKLMDQIQDKEQEIEQLNEQYNITITTNYDQNNSLNILNEEIDRLSYENKNYQQELKSIRGKNIDYNNLTAAYQQKLVQIVLLSLELDTVRGCVQDKDKQINDYKQKHLDFIKQQSNQQVNQKTITSIRGSTKEVQQILDSQNINLKRYSTQINQDENK